MLSRRLRSWDKRFAKLALAALPLLVAPVAMAGRKPPPTFYKDVLPILQQRCQSCHHAGEISMPLTTYAETRPWARAIANSVAKKSMPPWYADPRFGHFSNNPSLTRGQIETLVDWARSGAPAGNPNQGPPPRHWAAGWRISRPDQVFTMPVPVNIPARGVVEYTYEIVPTGFTKDEWVQMAEIRPSRWKLVHHAVVYIRPPHSKWLAHAPVGVPFTASTLQDPQDRRDALWTDSPLLLVYAPGSPPDRWPDGFAKFIPRGSDLVFQVHYMPDGSPSADRTSIGLVFAKKTVRHRVITLQLTNSSFLIPPEASHFPVETWGTLPNRALLLDLFPHMHLRGKKFEFDIVRANGSKRTLLYVNYDFRWQLHYRLVKPLPLQAGTKLQAIAWYDNTWNNPDNPDPNVAVRWGDYDFDEMMIGFFDIAVPPNENKFQFFVRHPQP
jgi:hypothetical protein